MSGGCRYVDNLHMDFEGYPKEPTEVVVPPLRSPILNAARMVGW